MLNLIEKRLNNKIFEKIILMLGMVYTFFIFRRGGDTRDIFSILLILITLYSSYILKYNKYRFYKQEIISSIIYVFFIFFSYYFSVNKENRLSILLGMTLYTILFMCICLNLKIEEKYYKYFIPVLILMSASGIFRGLKEVYLNYEKLSWYRIEGGTYTTVYAAELGIYLLIGIIALLYYKEKYKKICSLIYIVINLFLIISTQSRTTMFGIPLTLMILFIIWDNKKGIILVFLSLILGIFLFKTFPNIKPIKRLSTLTSIEKIYHTPRYSIFKQGIDKGKENLIKGEGFYKYKENKLATVSAGNQPHYHNIFIETFATQGLLALVSYIIFLNVIFWRLVKNYILEEERTKKYIKLLGVSVFLFSIIYGLSEPIFYFKRIYEIVFTIVTMSFIIDKNYKKDEK